MHAKAPPVAIARHKREAGAVTKTIALSLFACLLAVTAQGDDNRNAKVDVSYRKKGDTAWKTAMPLLRLQHERVYQGEGVFNVEMPNMFAGSILTWKKTRLTR